MVHDVATSNHSNTLGSISMIIYLYIKQHSITGLKYFGKTKKINPFKYSGSGKYWKRHYRKYGKEHIKTLEIFGFDNQKLCTEFALKFSEENNIVRARHPNGEKVWANMMNENGLDGGDGSYLRGKSYEKIYGSKLAKEIKLKQSIANSGENNNMYGKCGPLNPFYDKSHSKESKEKMKQKALNRGPMCQNTKNKISLNSKGKKKTEETKEKMRKPKPEGFSEKISKLKTGIIHPTASCNHCNLVASKFNISRWHNDNCKFK